MNAAVPSHTNAELIDRCNRLDLRHSGAVQPHAALIIISEDERRIVRCSANLTQFIPEASSEVVGSSVSDIPGISEAFQALGGASDSGSLRIDTLLRGVPIALSFDRVRSEGGAPLQLLTLERIESLDSPPPSAARCAAALLECIDNHSLWEKTVQIFAELTRFDRILLYRFLPDWSGEVVAEVTAGFEERYLNLRFPATDLPASARAMYRECRVRSISDSLAEPIPLLGADGAVHTPIDISLSPARSVAETHRVYLKNMGVRASVSFPIIRGADLWGLIACHDRQPRYLPHHIRQIGSELASVVSGQLRGFDAAARMEVIYNARFLLDQLLDAMEDFDRLRDNNKLSSELCSWCDAEGFAFFNGDRWEVVGKVPDPITLMAVRDIAYCDRSAEGVLMNDNLSALIGTPVSAAGMLSVVGGGGICAWFRPEITEQVAWAGKPDEWGELSPEDGLLRPRHSFGRWVEERKGHCAPWTEFDRHKGVVWRAAFVRKFSIAAPTW